LWLYGPLSAHPTGHTGPTVFVALAHGPGLRRPWSWFAATILLAVVTAQEKAGGHDSPARQATEEVANQQR